MTPKLSGEGCVMGSVYQTKAGRIGVSFKGHTYWRSQSDKFYSLKQAEKFLSYLQTKYDEDPKQFDHKRYGYDKRLVVEHAWERYTAESPCGRSRESSREQIFRDWICPAFGKRLIKDIHFVDIDEWAKKLLETHKGSTVKLALGVLHHFLKFYYTREMLDRMPGFPTVRATRKEIKWLTVEQQGQVMEFIPPEHQPIFRFLRDYGRRSCEACNLKGIDIDLAKEQIRIRNTKTGQDNYLPLGAEFREWFLKRPTLSYVFTRPSEQPYSRMRIRDIWHIANGKAHEKYGTPIVNSYEGNRKSFASQRMGRFDVALISACMGHSNIKVTQDHYGKVETKKLGDVVEIKK